MIDVPPGWDIDSDDWYFRPVRPGDPDRAAFDRSSDAFIDDGYLYCRDADQARGLDAGVIP